MKNFSRITFLFTFFFIFAALSTYSQPTSLNENDISFESSTTAILVGQDGLIMKTEDGGSNWNVIPSGVTNTFNASDYFTYIEYFGMVNVVSDSTAYEIERTISIVAGDNGLIMVSEDRDLNWITSPTGTLENINDVLIYNRDMIFACGNNGLLLMSSNHGASWEVIVTNTTANLNSISFSEYDHNDPYLNAVIAGDGGTVLVSNDNGATWALALSNTADNLNTAVITNSGLMIAAGNNGTIIRSSDAGLTWENSVSLYTGIVYDMRYLNGAEFDIFAASGENGTILRSDDMGMNWTIIETGNTNDLFALNFYDSQNGITVGENGTELYTIDGGLTWVNKETFDNSASSEKKSSDIKLNQNYPNPFNPSTVISYVLPFDAKVSIKVYDMLGRVVADLLTANQVSGTHSVSFNALGLSSGVYFYRLNAESGNQSFTKVMKMILTK
ncbi:MAG: T9SS type A sorting domain-containing protein [Ignavibacteria bacterium]|nr:T9SS type A sorting domain-containing protein [Ignavibacteria bacterium]